MSRGAKALLGLLGIALIAVVAMLIFGRETRSDDVLIKEALAESIQASKEGRPGGVMDFISDQLKINTQSGINKATIAKWIRDSKPDVEVLSSEVKVSPDGQTAEMVSDVNVSMEIGVALAKQRMDQKFTGVKMTFQKEDGRKFLVIPTKVWRLTAVDVPDDQLDLSPGF